MGMACNRGWIAIILVTFAVWIVDGANHDKLRDIAESTSQGERPRTTRPNGTVTTPHNQSSSLTCFKRLAHSFLWLPPFQQKQHVSPQNCADACIKIHDDQNEVRTCRAFDYNLRTNSCRLFERNSQDENVHTVNGTNSVIYELDEACLAKLNSTPTVPPYVACREGSKPLMERVSGYYLKASGLIFKQVPEKECMKQCLQDQIPDRLDHFKCQSVSYNDENKACVYLSQIARPLKKFGPPLLSDSRYRYYAKMCLATDAAAKCPGYITRFVGKQLVAMSDAKTTAANYSECVGACLTADTELGFDCLSGMFYNTLRTDNCILNYSDHYEEHSLFLDGEAQEIDYFSLKSCQW